MNYQETVFYQPDEHILYLMKCREIDITFSELKVPCCIDEIAIACRKLNSGKSAGSDYPSNEFFKFINVICIHFNKLFYSRYFPVDWSEGFIVPSCKNGNVDDVSNY